MRNSTHYPVHLEVDQPPQFQRVQVLLRVLVMIMLGFIGWPLGWLNCTLFVVLPITAAVLASRDASQSFPEHDGGAIAKVLGWVLAVIAWLGLLTDRVPGGVFPPSLRFAVEPQGRATPGSALMRFLTSLPHAFVLGLLGVLSTFLWVVAALCVIVARDYPTPIFNFQRGMLRWLGRFFAYHASLVDSYPPFALDTEAVDPTGAAPAAPAGAA